jgi:hypothetical protein
MRRDIIHAWSCDGEHFLDDTALARHMAARIDAGEDLVDFTREGCWFRLTYEDQRIPPAANVRADPFWRLRTYRVALFTNSPHCTGGNLFTSAWPEGYSHEPLRVIAREAPGAPEIADGTLHDIIHVLRSIGIVLWPDRHDV